MNRKEMIVVAVVLLTSFVTGAYGSPTIANMFITNNPLNVRVVQPAHRTTVLAMSQPLVTDLNGVVSLVFLNATGNYQSSDSIRLLGSLNTSSNIPIPWTTVNVQGGMQGVFWNLNAGPAQTQGPDPLRIVFSQQIDTSYGDVKITVNISPNCVNANNPPSCYQNVPISLTVLLNGR